MIKVLATDLDGTLLKPKRKFTLVEKENRKYIKSFYGDVVIVSGRNPLFCAKVCNNLNIDHNFIALNGAIIVKNGQIIYRQSMKKSIVANLLEHLKNNYSDFELLIFDKYDNIYSYAAASQLKAKWNHFKYSLKNVRLSSRIIVNNKKVERLLFDETDILKVIIYPTNNINGLSEEINSLYSEHFEIFTGKHSIELSPFGVNKGDALMYLINTTDNLTSDDVIVAGDSANDLPLFELFENSFLIGNSSNAELKIKTKYQIEKLSDLDKYTRLNNNFR